MYHCFLHRTFHLEWEQHFSFPFCWNSVSEGCAQWRFMMNPFQHFTHRHYNCSGSAVLWPYPWTGFVHGVMQIYFLFRVLSQSTSFLLVECPNLSTSLAGDDRRERDKREKGLAQKRTAAIVIISLLFDVQSRARFHILLRWPRVSLSSRERRKRKWKCAPARLVSVVTWSGLWWATPSTTRRET